MSTVLDSTLRVQSSRTEQTEPLREDDWNQSLRERKVLHIGKYYPPHFGGMESHLQSLCEQLEGRVGVEVIVANDDRETIVENIGGVNVTRVGTAFNFAAAPICPTMIRRIRETKADIVHIHLPNPSAILAYLASGHRGKLVVSYHSDVVRQKLLSAAFSPFLRYTLKKARAIVAGSPNYLESSSDLRRVNSKCRLITYAIPFREFQQRDTVEIENIKNRYGPRIVLGVGRLVYYKGFEYLIRAMKDIEGHLLIIGDGPLRGELERLAEDLGVSDRVSILTDVNDTRPFYQSADVFVLPSIARSEAFGIVQLEAMACGVPVVNTSLDSGVTYVSLHGVTGLTVPPEDSTALGQAINRLLGDPVLRSKLGATGRQRVEQVFSLEEMSRKTLKMYADVLE